MVPVRKGFEYNITNKYEDIDGEEVKQHDELNETNESSLTRGDTIVGEGEKDEEDSEKENEKHVSFNLPELLEDVSNILIFIHN